MIRLNEHQLTQLIKESVKRIISENDFKEASLQASQMKGQQVIEKIQSLVDQVNQIYRSAVQKYGDSSQFMDKEAQYYGLTSDVKLLKNGYLVIPFDVNRYHEFNGPEKIKVFTKSGGRYAFYKDYIDCDWAYAKKLLNKLLADGQRYVKDMEGYDVSWEDEENGNPQAIRNFNKSIGVKANARKPY